MTFACVEFTTLEIFLFIFDWQVVFDKLLIWMKPVNISWYKTENHQVATHKTNFSTLGQLGIEAKNWEMGGK